LFLAKLRELTNGSHIDAPADLTAAIEREATIASLGAAFSCLPERKRRQCSFPVTGNSLTDTFVCVEPRIARNSSLKASSSMVSEAATVIGSWTSNSPSLPPSRNSSECQGGGVMSMFNDVASAVGVAREDVSSELDQVGDFRWPDPEPSGSGVIVCRSAPAHQTRIRTALVRRTIRASQDWMELMDGDR
jgi:hypothetical protein